MNDMFNFLDTRFYLVEYFFTNDNLKFRSTEDS